MSEVLCETGLGIQLLVGRAVITFQGDQRLTNYVSIYKLNKLTVFLVVSFINTLHVKIFRLSKVSKQRLVFCLRVKSNQLGS